jgi:IS5 family transposase
MGPKPTVPSSGDLYRSRLDQILDQRHELFRLASLIDWDRFDHEFGRFYRPLGRPAKPTRLMVGLSYLQHTFNLSDEAVVQRWTENPYWHWLCGCEYFAHELPCDPSSLTRWRKRLGPDGEAAGGDDPGRAGERCRTTLEPGTDQRRHHRAA